MDVIALAEAGIDHAVAPLGTAITEAQLETLWKLAPEPVVALDGDAAGLAAAQRLIDLALPLPRRRPLAALRADAARPGPRRRRARRRRRGDAGAPRRLAPDRRPALERARPRARCSTAPSAAPRSTPGCARISPASPTPRSAPTGSARSAPAAPRSSRRRRARRARRAQPPAARRAAAVRARRRRRPPPPPATRASLLARRRDDPARRGPHPREARSSPAASTIPRSPHGARGPARARSPSCCRDHARNSRRPLVCARRSPQISRSAGRGAASRPASARDPLAELCRRGTSAPTATSGPPPTPEKARRAIEEELTRHAALTGRDEEIREAAAEIAGACRRGADRPRRAPPPTPSTSPTPGRCEDDDSATRRNAWSSPASSQLPRPAGHAGRENAERPHCESPIRKRQPQDPPGPPPPGQRWSSRWPRKTTSRRNPRTRPTAAARCST